ncbi:hypothetical protein E1193_23000 [Micromonospora sp. KC606]|uniref:hypothetical protein n=1 Tax=Micromonospora sp. KC606 TaxID=2530379 RepID=UPI001051D873|nr:hypothetical protein [Micromonospora sp. KC606]TDC77049.1 hypothetical protein E1193_23000 [Micromonospora sp. KC606]
MTTGEFSGVDQDLLADYLGGALHGTPEEAVVARLVEEDPAWVDAYAALAGALTRVSADLADLAEPAPQMPLAVVDRLAAALAGAGPAPAVGPDGAVPGDPLDAAWTSVPAESRSDTGRSAGSVLPAQGGRATPRTLAPRRDDASGPGRRRRRWTRLAAPVAVAAASLAVMGLGVEHLLDRSGAGDADTAVAGGAAADRAPYRVVDEPQHSGVDWTPETLADGTAASVRPLASPPSELTPRESRPGESAVQGGRLAGPGNLDRLGEPAALEACLGEVSAEHGRGPITVTLVDYASFRGKPALVLRFADPTGERWVWVSGAECGVPGSGADTRYQARVG